MSHVPYNFSDYPVYQDPGSTGAQCSVCFPVSQVSLSHELRPLAQLSYDIPARQPILLPRFGDFIRNVAGNFALQGQNVL